MKRRCMLGWTAAAGLPAVAPRPSTAQSVALRRVGVLAPSTAAREAVTLKPFFDEMERLGWVEGRTVLFDRTYAADQYHELPRLAHELVARQPELIFAPPMNAATAAKAATSTIPIVFATGTDPVGAGLVQSLSRPGGNATGMISVIESLAPKSLELLLQMVPAPRRLGLLGDPMDARLAQDRDALKPLLAARGVRLQVAAASSAQGFDAAVMQLLDSRVEVIMTNSSLTFNLRDRLFELLRTRPVVVVGHRRELTEAGALFSYGAALKGQIRRAAAVVDRILRGAKPADIPVQQPTEFDLVINLRTAQRLRVQVPQTMLLRANEVIE
jgi:putative ABC transport system substrate-binding protein